MRGTRYDSAMSDPDSSPLEMTRLIRSSITTGAVGFDLSLLARTPFDELPSGLRSRVYGVEYVRFEDPDGGELFVTRYGWLLLEHLVPEQWYHDKQYAIRGKRLPGSTGTVYKVPAVSSVGRTLELVVKFSRLAQDVPVTMTAGGLPTEQVELVESARFNNPFEEFGQVIKLRDPRTPPTDLRVRTKRPLAIYVPAEHFSAWQLGRKQTEVRAQQAHIKRDMTEHGERRPIKLEADRDYILLYEWVDGEDAESLCQAGVLTEEDLLELSRRVQSELTAKGFTVLDNKPKHFILRRRRNGQLLERDGKLVYLLVDFELLVRIAPTSSQ